MSEIALSPSSSTSRSWVARLLDVLALLAWIVLCFSTVALAANARPGEWYAALNKPSWNPPNWIFGPVWTTLYVMMGVSAWRVWRSGGLAVTRVALGLLLFQLLLNAAWTPLFFQYHQMGAALGLILVLVVAIAMTIRVFARHDRVAAWLLTPYIAWVSFASFLNGTLWWLNR